MLVFVSSTVPRYCSGDRNGGQRPKKLNKKIQTAWMQPEPHWQQHIATIHWSCLHFWTDRLFFQFGLVLIKHSMFKWFVCDISAPAAPKNIWPAATPGYYPAFAHTSPHPMLPVQPHQTKTRPSLFLVAFEGPIGGSLVFTPFPALGQNPVQQTRRSLGLGGHGLRLMGMRDLGPPHQNGALVFTLAPVQPSFSSSSCSSTSFGPPPQRM